MFNGLCFTHNKRSKKCFMHDFPIAVLNCSFSSSQLYFYSVCIIKKQSSPSAQKRLPYATAVQCCALTLQQPRIQRPAARTQGLSDSSTKAQRRQGSPCLTGYFVQGPMLHIPPWIQCLKSASLNECSCFPLLRG